MTSSDPLLAISRSSTLSPIRHGLVRTQGIPKGNIRAIGGGIFFQSEARFPRWS